MRIEWLPEAVRNRDAQLAYIGERNPAAAIEIGDAIESSISRLADFPESGRPGRVPGSRELVVTGTPACSLNFLVSPHTISRSKLS